MPGRAFRRDRELVEIRQVSTDLSLEVSADSQGPRHGRVRSQSIKEDHYEEAP